MRGLSRFLGTFEEGQTGNNAAREEQRGIEPLKPVQTGQTLPPPSPEPVVPKKAEDTPRDPEEEVYKPPTLAAHDIDIPEEPELVRVVMRTWNPNTQSFVDVDMGEQLLVPSGCKSPKHLSPYENCVTLKSALPRDKEQEANLFSMYQRQGWVSRNWVREHLDEEIKGAEVDKEIADDIPFMQALNVGGKSGSLGPPGVGGGVAQSPGLANADGISEPADGGEGAPMLRKTKGKREKPPTNPLGGKNGKAAPPPNAKPGSSVR